MANSPWRGEVGGFTDWHTEVYHRILAEQGFGISDAYPGIQLVHNF